MQLLFLGLSKCLPESYVYLPLAIGQVLLDSTLVHVALEYMHGLRNCSFFVMIFVRFTSLFLFHHWWTASVASVECCRTAFAVRAHMHHQRKFCVPDENLAKRFFFYTTPPLENGVVQDLLCLQILWRTKFLVTFDGFYGSTIKSFSWLYDKIYILCHGWTKS